MSRVLVLMALALYAAGTCRAQTGACCNPDGTCAAGVDAGACSFPSSFVPGGVCVPSPCPPTGTCCTLYGGCVVDFQAYCSGTNTWTAGRSCGPPNPCPIPTGSCCSPSTGACSVLVLAACAGPNTWTNGGTCNPNSCPGSGSCCSTITGACSVTLTGGCAAPRIFTPGAGVCSPNPCAAGAPVGLNVARAWLAAYYPFDDGSAIDLSGRGHDGVVSGAVSAADRFGHAGSAFAFDGASAVITVPDSTYSPDFGYNPATGLTLTTWAYRNGSGIPQHLIGKRVGCGGGLDNWQIALGAGALTTPQLPVGIWTHIAIVITASGESTFINGQLSSTIPYSRPSSFNPPATLFLGRSGTCTPFAGLLDEVGIYRRALNACEIAAIAAGQSICTADFDCSGSVTIQDLFGFLGAWFAHDLRADINAQDGTTVQDIFDFLAAWSSGC